MIVCESSRGALLPVRAAALFKADHSCAPLLPANDSRVRKFAERALAGAELQIPAQIGDPAEKCSHSTAVGFGVRANRRQRPTFAIAAFVSLGGSIIVRVHDH